MCAEFWEHVDSALFGSVFTLRRANAVVQSRIDDCDVERFDGDARLQHSAEQLNAALAISIRGVERTEDKAMNMLLGVSVAIAMFGLGLGVLRVDGILGGLSVVVRIVSAGVLVVAMAYLLVSGFLALMAYRVGEVYRPTLCDYEPLVDSTKQAMTVLYCIEQNQRVATLRSNRLAASFNCLRSGLVAVFLLVLAIIIGALLTDAQNASTRVCS